MSIKYFVAALSLLTGALYGEDRCCSEVYPFHFTVGYVAPEGVGYNKGYGSAELFASLPSYCNLLPFADVRGHIFEEGSWAGNAGAGVRLRDDCNNIAWGINAYYDYRENRVANFHQAGLGLEVLASCWAIRANGYLPFGKKHGTSIDVNEEDPLAIVTQTKRRDAMWGADLEGECCLFNTCDFLHITAGVGPYFYKTVDKDRSALGGRARLSWSAYDRVYASVTTSYDHIFNWIAQAEFGIRIPFGVCGRKQQSKYQRSSCCHPVSCCCDFQMMRRMVQPVRRHKIIVLDTHHETTAELLPPVPPPTPPP